ncbi:MULTISPECIES: TIR domain-containing protein [Paenibacillus]|uniref:TIR domain-containing protein n=1 Tax=Paenibacillus TaxID=44249 RepID=UPI0022B877E2|nr:TIR domain-containing protein [Paenibacillus caseinilyticus]MCZ8521879.1 TIR domain-containing protein [Paenibacillus caseinilyticus]
MSATKLHRRPYRLYLSHSWSYQEMDQELIRLLKQRGGFPFQIISLEPQLAEDLADERELYETIRAKMKHCDCVLVMCGIYAAYSRWINKELIVAKSELHKPVLGIQPFDAKRTSLIVKQHADALLPLEADAIVSKLRSLTE